MNARRALMSAGTALLCATMALSACGGSRSTAADDPDQGGAPPTTAATSGTNFGTLASPCGPGSASGNTDQGVTDTSISIGYGDDAGFASSPGLNHEVSDAIEAMVAWCNEQGGINGRTIDATYHDAAITEVNNAMTSACGREFFLVGESWALDSAQEQTRRGCGLPAVPASAVSPQFSNGPLMWQAVPNPVEHWSTSAAAQLAELYPEQVKKAATVYGNFAATIDTKDKTEATFPAFGWNFVGCDQEYNLQGEADWKPFVQRLRDCGVETVYFIGSPYPNFQNFLGAADQLGYEPIWYVDAPFYNPQFAAWNVDGLADQVYFRLGIVPFEEATPGSATQTYLDLVERNGGDTSLGGVSAASSFLLWATAAKACGSDLTRDCVARELDQVHEWTGGGLHAPTDPGANRPSECGMLVQMNGTAFMRVTPSESGQFACDPSFVAQVTGPVIDRSKLDANGVSQL